MPQGRLPTESLNSAIFQVTWVFVIWTVNFIFADTKQPSKIVGNQRVSLSNIICVDEFNFVIGFLGDPVEFQLLWPAGMGVTVAPHMDM